MNLCPKNLQFSIPNEILNEVNWFRCVFKNSKSTFISHYNVHVLGAVVNMIANLPFIYLWGLEGAMYATVISEFVVTAYQIWYIRDLVDLKQMFVNIPKYLIAGIVMFIPVFMLDNYLKTSILTLAFEVILGILLYIVMIIVLRPTSLDQIMTMIKSKAKGN